MADMSDPAGATRIHPTAIVHPEARIGRGVEIGAFCIVEATVKIGDGTRVEAHAQILGHTEIGAENRIFQGAVVGGIPQDRKFEGEPTRLVLGDRNHVRENVTLHLGTKAGAGITRIGNDNLIMACSHVAHDCVIEDNVTMGNNVLLAGHVHVCSGASISGGTVVHQFCTIGDLSYVGGLARVAMDVPPYLIFEGRPGRPRALNLIGLKRQNMSESSLKALKEAYRVLFHSSNTREAALQTLETGSLTAEVRFLVAFLRRSDHGYHGRHLEVQRQVSANGIARDQVTSKTAAQVQEIDPEPGQAGAV